MRAILPCAAGLTGGDGAADVIEPVEHHSGLERNGRQATAKLEGYEMLAIASHIIGSVRSAHLNAGNDFPRCSGLE